MSNPEQNPAISVVIPAFNEAKFLPECLLSLKKQNTDFPFEIIVVDNGSSDETFQIAEKSGVRVLREGKKGVCAARQTGTAAALGELVVSTDADTVFHPFWLQQIYDDFAAHPEAVGVTGPVNFVSAPWWGKWAFAGLFWAVKNYYRRTGKIKYICAANTAFRKSAFRGYNTNLTQGGDEVYLLRQLQAAGAVRYLDQPVHTSSRRLHKGLAYNLIVTFLIYYLFDYSIGRLRNKSILGSYKPIREHKPRKDLSSYLAQTTLTLVFAVVIYAIPASHVFAQRIEHSRMVYKTGSGIDRMEDKIEWRRL